jgi:hypothetical protein
VEAEDRRGLLGWTVGLFYNPAFEVAVIVGYWLTNDLFKDVAISLLYTLLIVVLIKFKIIQPITNYLRAP